MATFLDTIRQAAAKVVSDKVNQIKGVASNVTKNVLQNTPGANVISAPLFGKPVATPQPAPQPAPQQQSAASVMMGKLTQPLVNAAAPVTQKFETYQKLNPTPAPQPLPPTKTGTPWTVSGWLAPKKPTVTNQPSYITAPGVKHPEFGAANATISQAPTLPLAFKAQSQEEANNIALQAQQEEAYRNQQDAEDKGFFGALKQSLPNTFAAQAPVNALQSITQPFRSAANKLGGDINQLAPELDQESKLRTAADTANTAYEAAKLYYGAGLGGTGKLAGTLQALGQPTVIGGAAQALPEEAQGLVRPALEAYSVLSQPTKELSKIAGLNVLLGRADQPLHDYVSDSTKFSQPTQDALNLGLNLLENLVAVKGVKAEANLNGIYKPAVQEGYRVYKETGNLEKAMDTTLMVRDMITGRLNKESSTPGVATVLGVKKEAPVITERDIRYDKITKDVAAQKQLQETAKNLGLNTYEVRHFKQMLSEADAIDTNKVLNTSSNKGLKDSEMIALNNVISQNAKWLAENENKTFSNPQENAIHQMKVNAANNEMNMALNKRIKAGTEAGRTVVAMKLLANDNMSQEFWITQAKKQLGINADLTPEMSTDIKNLIAAGDRQGLAMYVGNLRRPGAIEKLTTLWKAGMLTSPATHVANLVGNTAHFVASGTSGAVATMLDKVIAPFTGERTTTVSPIALVKGTGKGLKSAAQIMWRGYGASTEGDKIGGHRSVNFGDSLIGKAANAYTRGIFNSLKAEDAIFFESAYNQSIASQAKIMGMNSDLRGVKLKEYVKGLLKNPTDEMKLGATSEAEIATFNNGNAATRAIAGVKASSTAARVATDVLVPFSGTPTNVVARILDYSPVGLVKTLVQLVKPSDNPVAGGRQKQFVNNLSKQITGAGLIYLGMALAKQGVIVGAAPSGQAESDDFYAAGKQPYSLNLGGHSFAINRLSVFGNLMGMGADYALQKDGTMVGNALAAGSLAAKNLTDQSFLKGVSGGITLLSDPQKSWPKFFGNLAGSVVPSIVASGARYIDPVSRNTQTTLDYFKARIPYLSKTIAPRVDSLGNIISDGRGVGRFFDPFNTKSLANDPVLNEASKVGYTIGTPGNTIQGVKLDPKELAVYQVAVAPLIHDTAKALIESPEYQSLSRFDKQQALKQNESTIHSQLNSEIVPQLMISRYNLPDDSDPENVMTVVQAVQDDGEFNSMTHEKQSKVLKIAIDALSGHQEEAAQSEALDSANQIIQQKQAQEAQDEIARLNAENAALQDDASLVDLAP